jgi:hypothetical protein
LGTAQTNAIFREEGETNHALDMGTFTNSPWGSFIQSHNKAAATSLPLSINPVGGNVGIGTSNPTSRLEVDGAATNTTAFNAAAGTTIDFSRSNLAYTTASAGAFTLTNIKDGGTYTLAVQATTSRQAVFSLNVIGSSNQYASLVFTGTSKHNVTVNQTLPVLLGSGLRGSVMMIGNVQNGTSTNNSFGHSDISDNNIRWSTHMNWPDGSNQMYTDLGSSTDAVRSFLNDGTVGLNKNKQYTIIRATSSKIVRVSGIDRNNTPLGITSRTWSAGSTFGVGLTTGSLDVSFNQNGYTGNIPEFILFPEPLTAAQFILVENNQILFWGAY